MSDDTDDSKLAQSIMDKVASCTDFREFGDQVRRLVVARNKAIKHKDARQALVYSYFLDGALAALTALQPPPEELEQTVGIVEVIATGLLKERGITTQVRWSGADEGGSVERPGRLARA